MNHNLELKLQAWVDGELSPAEARGVGEALASDAEGNSFAAELRSVRAAMAGQEMPRSVPETRDFYWSKIARQIEREAPTPQAVHARPLAGWQRWLASAAGFAALACVLLLALKPFAPPTTFDEISATGEGMEAVTFHDQSAGMTVVWLQDPSQVEQPASDAMPAPDSEQGTVEME